MTVIVLVAHSGMTYGGYGDWFYREVGHSNAASSVLFTLFNLTNQTYVMGLFFLVAGYFTPRSFDRKGPGRFLLDRAIRLGIPLVLFGLLLAPLTEGMIGAALGPGFWPPVVALWNQRNFMPGPMWFAEALLLYSAGYVAWRMLANYLPGHTSGKEVANPSLSKPLPTNRAWLISALGVGIAALLLRQVFPVDTPIFGLWFGFFASYIFLFAVGVAAYRYDWLNRLTWSQTRMWLVVSVISWPILPIAIAYSKKYERSLNFSGGLSWASVLYALWEPFVAWGLIALWLVWFRDRMNRPFKLWDWLNRRAFAVYVLHTPVLVGIGLIMRNWHGSSMAKFAALCILGCTTTWLISDPLVRIPVLRRIF
jgi:peptidoglycan/LPS O-acetylase OafA/YrhL